VLKHIQCVPWEHGETLADFELGRTTCALFLSLRYHKLHPNYIYERFQKLGKNYILRILLVLVDVVMVVGFIQLVYINFESRRTTIEHCAS
jgi:DNA excision repair protein ERCC-1